MGRNRDTKALSASKISMDLIQKRDENGEFQIENAQKRSNSELNPLLLVQVNNTLPPSWGGSAEQELALSLGLQNFIQPADGIEKLLCAQMAAVHNMAMTFLDRANIPEQHPEATTQNVERANKLLKIYTLQMEALNRHRGKGQQKVTVEHVTVNQGGQAVIGHLDRQKGGGGIGQT